MHTVAPVSEAPNRFDEPLPPGVVGLCGAEGSPYTQKVLAALRYRRIPHRFLLTGDPEEAKKPEPPGPKLLPKLLLASGESGTADLTVLGDSTPLLQKLEQLFPRRTIYPEAADLMLLVLLLEDFCDEWVTKAMYHYRWTYDTEAAAYGIGVGRAPANPAMQGKIADVVGQRQVSRLPVVGSNAATGRVIEEATARLLVLLGAHFDAGHEFLMGSRPSAADFALFGQLSPMVCLDPDVSRQVFGHSRRVWFWVHAMRDLSGRSIREEGEGWFAREALPPTLRAVLAEVGRLYAPFMVANARAVEAGAAEVEAPLDSGCVTWKQPSFKYQAKCLRKLREEHAALGPQERAWFDRALVGTGCSCLFEGEGAGSGGAPNSRL